MALDAQSHKTVKTIIGHPVVASAKQSPLDATNGRRIQSPI